jgi:predicted CXXCH cytochrome family protein
MHASQEHNWNGTTPVPTTPTVNGNWLGGTGASHYLLKLPADQLCVTCHDALGLPAPTAATTTPPAGGTFAVARVVGVTGGHTLGGTTSMATAQASAPTGHELRCATCHSPHGSTSFRNLRIDPSGKGEKHPVVARVIEKAATGAARREAAYASENIVYRSGMSDWCRSCHAEIHGHGESGAGALRADDATLGGSPSVDVAAWLGAIDARVRVERPAGDDRPSPGDRVMCLTCHRAHGSENRAALIFADGHTLTSTCQQCHDE